MDNLALALALYELADLLDLQGEDPFKIRAYRKAGQALELMPEEAAAVAARQGMAGLLAIPGIGKAIAEKLLELLTTGQMRKLEEVRAAVPPGLKELVKVPGLGARSASLLYSRLAVASLDDLELAARQGRLRDLPGFGTAKEQQILRKLPAVRRRLSRTPGAALTLLARALAAHLAQQSAMLRCEVAGSLRRACDTVGDIDPVLASTVPAKVGEALTGCALLKTAAAQRPGHWRAEAMGGHGVDIYVVRPEEFGAAWLYATGSPSHLEQLQQRAALGGTSLGPVGLYSADGTCLAAADEAEIYAALGLAFVPPELREGEDEVQLAAAGALPPLIEAADMRGELHVHTRASDGSGSLAEMAQAAADRGYAYLAITDHSPLVRVTNGLDAQRLTAQREELRRLGRVGPTTLLHGCEIDIRQDGELDLPTDAVRALDVVVASVHLRYGQDEAAMTERVLTALRTGLVGVLGHPTGRLVGERDPFDIDLEQVFALAAEQGVALEMSADPARLDLSGELARRAKAAGCRLSINTDAHVTTMVGEVGWGIAQGRRAGLTAADVVNCLPLPELLAWLRRNR